MWRYSYDIRERWFSMFTDTVAYVDFLPFSTFSRSLEGFGMCIFRKPGSLHILTRFELLAGEDILDVLTLNVIAFLRTRSHALLGYRLKSMDILSVNFPGTPNPWSMTVRIRISSTVSEMTLYTYVHTT